MGINAPPHGVWWGGNGSGPQKVNIQQGLGGEPSCALREAGEHPWPAAPGCQEWLPHPTAAEMTNSCSVCVSRIGCVRLFDPMDCSPPGSSVVAILQARILASVAMPSSRIFPTQGSNRWLLRLLHWWQILYCWTTREALSFPHLPLKPSF